MKEVRQVTLFRPNRPLYPTWFRWKDCFLCWKGRSMITLYPTWFRWKDYLFKKWRKDYMSLYPTWFRWKVWTPKRPASKVKTFISHMVQMKDSFCFFPFLTVTPLYPTWFRWKYRREYNHPARLYALYPTWFRWKKIRSACSARPPLRLYIPHGSDESEAVKKILDNLRLFISHMVQMKEKSRYNRVCHTYDFISHMVQMKGRKRVAWRTWKNPLYPTWFRWKITIFQESSGFFVFISHMVQMKAVKASC